MAGSNIVLVKRALLEALRERLGVECSWSYVGKHHQANREYLYFGERAQGPMAAAAMAGGGRFARQEDLTFLLVILVNRRGEETTETAEADAVAIGAQVEEYLGSNWTLGGDIPGVLKVTITDFELESGADDDGADATLAYTIQLSSHVR